MIIYRKYRFLVLLLLSFLFINCEKQTDREISVRLHNSYLNQTEWISVDKDGNPEVKDFQKCKLIFLGNNEYEIKKTFEYSGSTFRSPGIYEIQGNKIKLKSLDGKKHLGDLYLHKDDRLKIEWFQTKLVYGEGTEIFIKESQVKEQEDNRSLIKSFKVSF